MSAIIRILHLEDNPADAELMQFMLAREGIDCAIRRVETRADFERALAEDQFDLIISDYTLPSFDGRSALEIARQKYPQVPFIFVSGTIGEEAAVESLKEGAVDYVLKDRTSRLVASVRRAIREARERAERQRIEEELRQHNELFRLITENVDDLIVVLDRESRRVFSSPSYRPLLGDPQALEGTEFFSEIHPEDRERVRRSFRETVASGVGQRTEFRFLLKDGTVRYVESQGSVIRNPDGRITNVVVVSRDITGRKQAEARIREQAALLDQAHDAILVSDMDQRILYWNRGAERLYGWKAEEAVGRNANELLFGGNPAVPLEALKNLIGRGEWHGEVRHFTRAGKEIVVESRWTLLQNEQGRPRSILVINTDITERKQSEQKIREQAALLDEARDAIYVRDLEQRVTYWGKGAERLYGWKAAEILGQRASEILYRPDAPKRYDIWKAVLEKGEWTGELKQVTRSGQEVVVVSRRSLLRDPNGKPTAVLNINTDVTEKKQLEEKFLRAQRLESIGALAGGIAHDLNNVLAPVVMATELLQDEVSSDLATKMLETIRASANRGGDMVKQILSFARGASGEPVVLQLRHLIKDIAKLVQDTFPRSIKVQTRVSNNLQPILGDATQLHQVLLNLCVNARDAMPRGGTLLIEAENEVLEHKFVRGLEKPLSGPFVVLTVSDTGTGIPHELLDKIFETFFTTKAPGKGTGLGLSTVTNIVKNHGGLVEVSSEVGRGTSFKVYLPATAEAAPQPAQAQAAELLEGHGEQILVVDDERALLEMTKETLETYGYRVLSAGNGAEALHTYQQHGNKIAAVVSDVMMPVMDGPVLIRSLRELNPGVKIICVSGLASEHKLAEIDKTHVRSFLTKPFTSATLLSTLRQVITAN